MSVFKPSFPEVSIHAPTRGATRTGCCKHSSYGCFNPRSHEGSDTKCRNDTAQPSGGFNPRSHEGSDLTQDVKEALTGGFNPRSHEGSDGKTYGALLDMLEFQSTLPRGERQL